MIRRDNHRFSLTDAFKPTSEEERGAFIDGENAMQTAVQAKPSPARFRALHALRVAARLCPGATYNLGNLLSQHSDRPRRKRRRAMAMQQFARAAEILGGRIRDHAAAHEKWPADEYMIRDIASRALTNIGGQVANAGRPEDAVDYFRRAVTLFPENSNAHVCLGNMAVLHHARTNVDPLVGIAEWKIGGQLGDFCHESASGCSCRAHVVALVEDGVERYGAGRMSEWIVYRLSRTIAMGKKSLGGFLPLVRSADDVSELRGRPWPADVVTASRVIGEYLDGELRDAPLEMKVTIAGSLLQTVALSRRASEAQRWKMIEEGIEFCSEVEMLEPFLGDEEWKDIGPPDSLYLDTPKSQAAVFVLVKQIQSSIPATIKPDAIIKGLLLHLDSGFRSGVSSMVRGNLWRDHGGMAYVPAVYVGNPTRRH